MEVLVKLYSKSLGDTIALMPYLERYRLENKCNVSLLGNSYLSNLFTNSYPFIKFVDNESNFDKVIDVHYNFYKPVQQGMAEQLGYKNPIYIRPKIDSSGLDRQVKNKYITLGVHSTSQLKYWNHPEGKSKRIEATNWNDLCRMLRKQKITPICLEKDELFGVGPEWNGLPNKSVKKLNLSLTEVINYIEHSEFYIGLSSGVAWIAHALGKRVAMIANFTEDWNEFDLELTDYKRITNKSVCHGCWNNPENKFDNGNWNWCPKHENTSRHFECHTSITPERVFEEIKEWL
jgi:autotransporter strand-loop-strand O-heptosyltransferase